MTTGSGCFVQSMKIAEEKWNNRKMKTRSIYLSSERIGNDKLKCFADSVCCWNGLWLLLFFIGTGIFFIGMPKYCDDYWYMFHLQPWFESQGIDVPSGGDIFRFGIPWEDIYQT